MTTISTSARLRTMSDRPNFGRDAKEFLADLGDADNCESLDGFGIRITSISPASGERVTVKVLVSNPSGREETEFSIMNIHAEELCVEIGAIDEEMLPELEYYAEVARAYSSACSSFAFAPSSYAALKNKLLQKGFRRDVSDDAIDCLRRHGFVKEDEIALRRAQIFVGKKWGRSKILMKLREEGFGDESLTMTLAYLAETDFSSSCAELICKRFGDVPEDKHDRDLMYASLSRMGYSTSDIRGAIKLLQNT